MKPADSLKEVFFLYHKAVLQLQNLIKIIFVTLVNVSNEFFYCILHTIGDAKLCGVNKGSTSYP